MPSRNSSLFPASAHGRPLCRHARATLADAFPKEDIAVRNNLGGVSAKQAEELSSLAPWRSYA